MENIWNLFKQTQHPKDVSDYYHVHNLNNVLNSIYWWEFFKEIGFHKIEGDIVECGVGRGRSLITLCAINKLISAIYNVEPRSIFALDSFEGFPEPTNLDMSSRNPKKGEWSKSPNNQFQYTPENLKMILRKAEIDEKVNIIRGFFDKTTPSLPVKKISILHLDGDLYEFIKIPLNNLSKKVSIGGIIIIDDFLFDEKYSSYDNFPGARKAVKEFASNNSSFEYLKSIRGTPYLKKIR